MRHIEWLSRVTVFLFMGLTLLLYPQEGMETGLVISGLATSIAYLFAFGVNAQCAVKVVRLNDVSTWPHGMLFLCVTMLPFGLFIASMVAQVQHAKSLADTFTYTNACILLAFAIGMLAGWLYDSGWFERTKFRSMEDLRRLASTRKYQP